MAATIITTDDITLADRRKTVREMAHVSAQAFPDADLDRRITQADQIARIKWPGNIIPTDADDLSVFIKISNMETAIAILTGLGKATALEMVRRYTEQTKYIIDGIQDDTEVNSPVVITRARVADQVRRGSFV